jgi:cyanophycin synthetase
VRRSGYGVANADDPLVVIEAGDCDGTVIYFSRNPGSPVLSKHVKRGGMAGTLDDGWLVLLQGREATRLLPASAIPATMNGLIPFQVENALAAAAAAWGAGVSPEVITSALATFRAGEEITPGRFNVFEGPGYTVVVDFAHNPAAMRAQGEMVAALRERYRPERVIGVVAAPGDRRDQEITDVATIAAGYFDILIVRDDDDLRGREPGEVSDMMAEAARKVLPPENVYPVEGEFPALHMAFDMLRPGDLLVVCAVQIDQTLQDVHARLECDQRSNV